MGLSAGGLIRSLLEKLRKCILLFVYFLIEENLCLKSYLFGSKIGINGLIHEGLYEGGLIRGVTQVSRKR